MRFSHIFPWFSTQLPAASFQFVTALEEIASFFYCNWKPTFFSPSAVTASSVFDVIWERIANDFLLEWQNGGSKPSSSSQKSQYWMLAERGKKGKTSLLNSACQMCRKSFWNKFFFAIFLKIIFKTSHHRKSSSSEMHGVGRQYI